MNAPGRVVGIFELKKEAQKYIDHVYPEAVVVPRNLILGKPAHSLDEVVNELTKNNLTII